jgi:uncharacterized protein DUF3147
MKRIPSQKFETHVAGIMDYIIRFLAGGLIVSIFAILGDVLRPKSFAGLFGAAPSVALATLTLAFFKQGGDYVAHEGRSMMLGALAMILYSIAVCQLLVRLRWSAFTASTITVLLWGAVALGSQWLLRG